MDIPSKIISIKTLTKRWAMSRMDILLMAMNHDLKPVFRTTSGWKHYCEKDNDIFEIINLFLSPGEIIFLSADIYSLENKISKKIAKSDNIISDSELIKRWGISNLELWDMEENQKLHFVDPLGNPITCINKSLRSSLYPLDEDNILQLYYDQSEIERIEKEHGIKQKNIIKKNKRGRLSAIHKERCREIAKKLWDKDPQKTIQDMIYEDEINNCFDGKSYSEKTIRNLIKNLSAYRSPGRRPKK